MYDGGWQRTTWIGPGVDRTLGHTLSFTAGTCGAPPADLAASAVSPASLPVTFAHVQSNRNDLLAVVDATGAIIERRAYDVYGLAAANSATGATCDGSVTSPCEGWYGAPVGFAGSRAIAGGLLRDMRFRAYSPGLRLSTSRDPLGYVDSFDLWLYAGGDPLNGIDPFGLEVVQPVEEDRGDRPDRGGCRSDFCSERPQPLNIADAQRYASETLQTPFERGLGASAAGAIEPLLHPVDTARALGACALGAWGCVRDMANEVKQTVVECAAGDGLACGRLAGDGVLALTPGATRLPDLPGPTPRLPDAPDPRHMPELDTSPPHVPDEPTLPECFEGRTRVATLEVAGAPIAKLRVGDVVLGRIAEGSDNESVAELVLWRLPEWADRLTSRGNDSLAARLERDQEFNAQVGDTYELTLRADSPVLAYDARSDRWTQTRLSGVVAGREFLHGSHLCRRSDSQTAAVTCQGADANRVRSSHATWPADREPRSPGAVDFVYVTGVNARHTELSHVVPGESFAFDGRIYNVRLDADHVIAQLTGVTVHRVASTSRRSTDTLVELHVVDGAGGVAVLRGTPEHPFFVPATGRWVPMGELTEGTMLDAADGSQPVVVGSELRFETTDVFNFEVEHAHNYFVGDSERDGTAVLVHNTCRWTNAAARRAAADMGFEPTSTPGWASSSVGRSPVFRSGNRYMSPDSARHGVNHAGGDSRMWKELHRDGTYTTWNADLTEVIRP